MNDDNTIQENPAGGPPLNPLGTAPVAGLIIRFAIPSITALLVSAAYNITDQIFIGWLIGIYGNAATNVAFPVTVFVNALALLIGPGIAANYNICMGAKRMDEAERYLGTGLVLMVICGPVFMALVLIFKTPILLLCGATVNVLPYADVYLGLTAFSIPFFLFTLATSYVIRADGSPAYSMICTVSGALLNIFLDFLFIYVFSWGMQGAGAATVIAQGVSFILCVAYLPRFKTIKIRAAILRVKSKYAIGIVKLGIPNFINQVIIMVVNIVMNNTLTYYGASAVYGSDIPLAVSGVVAKLNSILISLTVGLSQGCQPVFSYNTGAKNYARVKETYKKALVVALAISVCVFVVFQLFPQKIVSIFGEGSELYYEFAERYVRIFLMMVCFFGVQPLSVSYFTSTGNSRLGIILSASRQGLFLIPLLLILPMFLGLEGILFSGPIADTLACILSLVLVFFDFRHLSVLQKAQLAEPE